MTAVATSTSPCPCPNPGTQDCLSPCVAKGFCEGGYSRDPERGRFTLNIQGGRGRAPLSQPAAFLPGAPPGEEARGQSNVLVIVPDHTLHTPRTPSPAPSSEHCFPRRARARGQAGASGSPLAGQSGGESALRFAWPWERSHPASSQLHGALLRFPNPHAYSQTANCLQGWTNLHEHSAGSEETQHSGARKVVLTETIGEGAGAGERLLPHTCTRRPARRPWAPRGT